MRQENHSNPLTAMFHIASDSALPAFPDHLSPLARDFLALCFVKEPNARPSAKELSRHLFVSAATPLVMRGRQLDSNQVEPVSTTAGGDLRETTPTVRISAELSTNENEASPTSTFQSDTLRTASAQTTETGCSARSHDSLAPASESSKLAPAPVGRRSLEADDSSDVDSCASFSSSLDGVSSSDDENDTGIEDGASAEYSSDSDSGCDATSN